MKKRDYFIGSIFSIFGLMAIAGCTSTATTMLDEELPVPNERKDIVLSRSEGEIVNYQNEFSLKLFKDGNSHSFFSPISISMAMSLVANATAGETRRDIIDFLGFPEADLDAVNTFNFRLARELAEADNTVALALANSIWLDYSLSVKQGFIDDVKASYGAEIFDVDLDDDSTKDNINMWCSEKTNGMIPEFMKNSGLSDIDKIALYNASYFNGRWSAPFKKNDTRKGRFYNINGSIYEVDMMYGQFDMGYNKKDGIMMVRIPYGNGAFEMVVFVSDDSSDINAYVESLTLEELEGRISSAATRKVNLTMPKFEMKTALQLSYLLKRFGVNFLNNYSVDFSPLTDERIALAEMQQLTHIKVDEKGTESAAVTGTKPWGAMPGAEEQIIDVAVDHPFVYIIRESSTGAYLFMGGISYLDGRPLFDIIIDENGNYELICEDGVFKP